jgi:hypothetical protein
MSDQEAYGLPQGQDLRVIRVQCAHCGAVYYGGAGENAPVWAAAMGYAGSHQEKTYAYAPELKPCA